jgi:hypothetical protein
MMKYKKKIQSFMEFIARNKSDWRSSTGQTRSDKTAPDIVLPTEMFLTFGIVSQVVGSRGSSGSIVAKLQAGPPVFDSGLR